MSYATIRVSPVTPRIGAVVSNIDLTATLSNQQVEDLHTALAEHQVLFFRDQRLNLDQQKMLGRKFGELHIHPNTPGPEGHPEILPIHADGNSKRANGENWLALATKAPPKTGEQMDELRDEMEALAAQFGGEYDGWEAAIDSLGSGGVEHRQKVN